MSKPTKNSVFVIWVGIWVGTQTKMEPNRENVDFGLARTCLISFWLFVNRPMSLGLIVALVGNLERPGDGSVSQNRLVQFRVNSLLEVLLELIRDFIRGNHLASFGCPMAVKRNGHTISIEIYHAIS